jgi:DNA-binding NtrC family response regulator
VASSSVPRVFVVDDEYVIASTLAAILNMSGFSAKFFTCPLQALEAARWESPDLVISDVEMPGITGIELVIQMRALYPKCKVLLFSGQAATSDLLENSRNQGHDFQLLEKPVHPSLMLSTIGTLMPSSPVRASRREVSTKTVTRTLRSRQCTRI